MKLGILAPDLSGSHGWSQYAVSVLRALQKQGAAMTILTAKNSPMVADLDTIPLLPNVVPTEGNIALKSLQILPTARYLLRDCTVIHNMVEWYAPLAWRIARRRPLFMTAHGTYVNLPRMRRFPMNVVFRQAFSQAHLICVSHYTEKIAHQVLPHIHTTVINNAVNAERFAQIVASAKTGRLILASGGVKKRKGTLELVRAVAKVRQTLPDVQCVVVGRVPNDAYTDAVKADIDALQLGDCVRLVGYVSDEALLTWYSRADVFVLPSINAGYHFEGFGLVHLEASAAGLPVIGTDDCGVEDAIVDGQTGVLVSQACVAEVLPVAILDLLTHPEKAQQMGNAGKLRAQTQTWDHVASELIRLYEN